MIQRGEDLRFALEAGEALDVRGEGIRQHLQRDIAIQLGIVRPIHLAHAAFAEFGEDLIRSKALADHHPVLARSATARSRRSSRVDAWASGGGPPDPSSDVTSYPPSRTPGARAIVTSSARDASTLRTSARRQPASREPRRLAMLMS